MTIMGSTQSGTRSSRRPSATIHPRAPAVATSSSPVLNRHPEPPCARRISLASSRFARLDGATWKQRRDAASTPVPHGPNHSWARRNSSCSAVLHVSARCRATASVTNWFSRLRSDFPWTRSLASRVSTPSWFRDLGRGFSRLPWLFGCQRATATNSLTIRNAGHGSGSNDVRSGSSDARRSPCSLVKCVTAGGEGRGPASARPRASNSSPATCGSRTPAATKQHPKTNSRDRLRTRGRHCTARASQLTRGPASPSTDAASAARTRRDRSTADRSPGPRRDSPRREPPACRTSVPCRASSPSPRRPA